jgi:serine/threonine protein kinase
VAPLTGQMISHYKIIDKLGEGGMGVVYRAEDLKLTRTVALKFVPRGLDTHEPERARFLQEARAAAILNRPNICTVHDIQEYEGQQFIVMECVEGKTHREMIPLRKMEDAIGYAIQIREALQEAHAHGIVHRDIKAEHIMTNGALPPHAAAGGVNSTLTPDGKTLIFSKGEAKNRIMVLDNFR